MRVEWRDDGSIREAAGHGVDFYYGSERRYIAQVLGYEWYHADPDFVVVSIVPRMSGVTSSEWDEIRNAITAFLVAKGPIHDQETMIAPDLVAHLNA